MTSEDRGSIIEYEALRDSLSRAGAVLAAPELHGGICGALCASGPLAAETWLDEGFAEEADPHPGSELRVSLHDLVVASWNELTSTGLEFEPLLPDEAAPLDEQVQALAAWCQGFLGGLGFAAPDLRAEPVGGTATGEPYLNGTQVALGDDASAEGASVDGAAENNDPMLDGAVAADATVHLGEICADFVEISRAGLSDGDVVDRDHADFALAELREYVRVSVQIAFEELAVRRAQATTPRELH